MKIAILTNGDYGDYGFCKPIEKYDYIICADNGIKHARALGITPDYILGDFDSASLEDRDYFSQVETLKVSAVKDETDTELAVDRAISLGALSIDILGGLGSRIDHTLANIHLLQKGIEKGVSMRVLNHQNTVHLINQSLTLEGKPGDLISLLPLSVEVEGVYTEGLAYALSDACFKIGKPYGISNYMIGSKIKVSVKKGLLLLIQTTD